MTQNAAPKYTTLTDVNHSYQTNNQQLQIPHDLPSEAEKLIADFELANTCAVSKVCKKILFQPLTYKKISNFKLNNFVMHFILDNFN